MSTKQRTPEHFPGMKVRGSRRRRSAPYQRAAGSLHRLAAGVGVAAAALASLSMAIGEGER
jgi:hypothetical protein